jgi:hypothetical protein
MNQSLRIATSQPNTLTDFDHLLQAPDQQVLQAHFSRLSQSTHMVNLCKWLLANGDALASVASRSYPHVLGFDKIVLSDGENSAQLRVHVWWPDRTPTREDVHNHRAAFWSHVLTGRLACTLYEEIDSASDPGTDTEVIGMAKFRECGRVGDQEWDFEHLGPASLRPTVRLLLAPGTSYELPAETLHRIEVPVESLVVTVVLQRGQKRQWSTVYAEPTRGPTLMRQRRFTAVDLRERLAALQAVL